MDANVTTTGGDAAPGPETLDALLERCRDLHEDLELSAVRAWKEANAGGIAIGYMPIYVPAEIIDAVGALPVGIIGGGDRTDIIRGDAYFQSYICRIPRSTVELGLRGKLDSLDGMLFPAICDVIRNLSGIWQILFPGKYVHFLDFPQNFAGDVGGWFYERELRTLARDLSRLTGRPLDDERLRRSIRDYDENRALILELHATRARSPHTVSTYEAYLVQRAGHVLPVREHNALVRRYLDLAAGRGGVEQDNARIVLVGAFCEQPPLALIKSLELAGCYIVDDDFLLGNRILGQVGTEGDPVANLVRAYLGSKAPSSSIYDGEEDNAAALVRRVRETRADGVVLAAPSFCDPALLDRPRYQRALDEAGIPYTALKYAENTGQLGAIREQVGTFAESIRLWGDAPAEPQTVRT
jgi:benzoyl-CoA reductase subunit C